GRRTGEAGERADRLRGADGEVRRTRAPQLTGRRGQDVVEVLAQRVDLLASRRVAAEVLAAEPRRAQRQRHRDVRLLVEPGGQFEGAAADVEHEQPAGGPPE